MKPDPSLGFCDIEIDQEMLRYFKMFLLLTSYMYTYNTIDQAKIHRKGKGTTTINIKCHQKISFQYWIKTFQGVASPIV